MNDQNQETGRKLKELGRRLRLGLAMRPVTLENQKKRKQIIEDAVRERFEKRVGAGTTKKTTGTQSET
jgi:hypothetical protein